MMFVRNEKEFADAMRYRREVLGEPSLAVDDRAGTPDGYVGKLENPDKHWGKRSLNPSTWYWLGALRLVLLIVPAEHADSVRKFLNGDRRMPHSCPSCGMAFKRRKRTPARAKGHPPAPAAFDRLNG